MARVHDVGDAWERNAEEWLAWARTPDHDVFHWRLNFPQFVALLPDAGHRTLDVGCGEGRVGRWLARTATALLASIARLR
jgi:2-polyprenyl-3-methyl-5-hydroxy-6-metoxy-1,4-benzoquinol methylase